MIVICSRAEEYLKIGEVAKELGICTQSLRNYDYDGSFKADLVTDGGTRFYKRESVERFKKERRRR